MVESKRSSIRKGWTGLTIFTILTVGLLLVLSSSDFFRKNIVVSVISVLGSWFIFLVLWYLFGGADEKVRPLNKLAQGLYQGIAFILFFLVTLIYFMPSFDLTKSALVSFSAGVLFTALVIVIYKHLIRPAWQARQVDQQKS